MQANCAYNWDQNDIPIIFMHSFIAIESIKLSVCYGNEFCKRPYTDFTQNLLKSTKFAMNMKLRCRKSAEKTKAEYNFNFSVVKCKMKTQNKDKCISTLFHHP